MKRLTKIATAATMLALASVASADLNRVGPANNPSPPGNGFPAWYQDLNGMVLDFCLPTVTAAQDPQALQRTACLLVDPGPYTFPNAFPAEVFYHRVVSNPLTTSTSGKRATLVLALEGSFSNGTPTAGQQMVFTRIRVTAGVPFDGDYRVTHPYGVETFTNVTSGAGNRDIFWTEDVGLSPLIFTDALTSRVGPFLQHSDIAPGGAAAAPVVLPFDPVSGFIPGVSRYFLGDGVTGRFITGSPFATNYFEICGPLPATDPRYACYKQDLFTVTGMLHDPNTPVGSALSVTRSSYSRANGSAQVDVMARASQSPGQPNAPKLTAAATTVSPVLLAGPTNLGDWYAQGIAVPSSRVPNQIAVTNSGDVPPTTVLSHVVDEVTITSVGYSAGTLTVSATSSDKGDSTAVPAIPPAVLTLEGYPTATVVASATDPAGVTFTAAAGAIPPAFVRVASDRGGLATADTILGVANPVFPGGVPFAVDDNGSVEQATVAAVPFDVVANDVGGPLGITAGSLAIVPPLPAIGVASVLNGQIWYTAPSSTGTATVRYTVANAAGISNVGTLTIAVTPALNPIPTAVNDPAAGTALNVTSGQFIDIPVAANDLANGGVLDMNSILITTAPAAGRGTAVPLNDGTGRVRFTGGNTTGTATFQYTIANTNGQRSAAATVTVNVAAAELLTIQTPAKCSLPNKWQLRGTSNISAGNTITIYQGAVAPGATIIGTAPVVNGAWQFQGTNFGCVSPISIQSTIGTKIQTIVVQIK